MSKLHKILPLAIAAIFAQAAGAQPSKGPSSAQPNPAAVPVGAVKTRTSEGTVESIDSADRRVVLKGLDGDTTTVVMGPQVKDFNNLKKGDEVTVRHTEAVVLALAKGDKGDLGEIRRRVDAEAFRQGPAGDKPSVSAMERTTLVANVFQIDRQAGTVTLRGISGVPIQMRVQNKQSLEGIEKNDQVVVSYREAAALSVERGSSTASSSGKSGERASSAASSSGKSAQQTGNGGKAPTTGGSDTGAGSANKGLGSAASATRSTGSPGKSPSPGQPGTK